MLGAGGTIAPAIVRDLAASEEVDRLVLLDLDQARAAEVAEQHAPGRATVRTVDARERDSLRDSRSYADSLPRPGTARAGPL